MDGLDRPPSDPKRAKFRIMVVDDEDLVRDLLSRYLLKLGYEVILAGDGAEALRLYRKHAVDLVLSDVRMPHLDGLQLLVALKDLNPRLPVVMISGHGEVETVVRALKAGADNFLAKPLRMDVMARVLEQSLAVAWSAPHGLSQGLKVFQTTLISAPSRKEMVQEVVQVVARSAVSTGYCRHDLDNNLKLALVEGVTNAMEHGNRWDERLSVTIQVEMTSDRLQVSIADQGPGFDQSALPDPTHEENLICERGRGVFLMRAIMDEVTYTPPGNRLTMVKHKPDVPVPDAMP
ncbi:MAG: response regulator [Desulfarculus sp.]|nr:response regulator [Desulfarculus sp.]